MSIESWAEKNGETPKAQIRILDWFSSRPGLVEQAKDAYQNGWSWEQIRSWLEQEHGFPLKDAKSVARVCR